MKDPMKDRIDNPNKDPLGSMMIDYLNGERDAGVTVQSDTLDMWEMTGATMFRSFSIMNRIERKALSLCTGKILDIGAGAGSHTLYLQNRGETVDALDLSPGSVRVMKKRKVRTVIHNNLFALKERQYDTLLMLMNGIGVVGSLDGLNLFFQFIKTLLTPGGQVLMDSTDLALLYEPDMIEPSGSEYYGETEFTMTYKQITGDPFQWLYVDFQTLCRQGAFHGFECEKLLTDRYGKYLARIRLTSSSQRDPG